MSVTSGAVVVGIDGSHASQQALVLATELAVLQNRVLTLLHAGDATGGETALAAAHDEARTLAPELVVREERWDGDPREAILELSETASTVVLGSRGRGHLRSLLLGSTAVAAVRHARCPVIVHRPTPASPERRGVAVGVDATEESVPVLEFAYEQASLRGLPLTVVHSFWYFQSPPTTWDPPSAAPETLLEEQRRGLAESLSGYAERYPDVTVHIELDEGMPERHLLGLADTMDLLVVGAHHGTRAQQFMFGAVSVWLVEHANCPVAVVPLSVD